MLHYYNVFTIDGKKFKLDIAGLLMAEDFNIRHPDIKINLEDFYFSENIDNNPFAQEVEKKNAKDYVSLSQPQQE